MGSSAYLGRRAMGVTTPEIGGTSTTGEKSPGRGSTRCTGISGRPVSARAARLGWRLDRAAAGDYLASLREDLREDTAALSAEIHRAEEREAAARLILGVVLDQEPIQGPSDFVLDVVNASIYGEPVQARETFDDLVATGRLGLIPDDDLRRRLADYYHFVERRSQSYDLQRQRVWGDYLPLSVAAVPWISRSGRTGWGDVVNPGGPIHRPWRRPRRSPSGSGRCPSWKRR